MSLFAFLGVLALVITTQVSYTQMWTTLDPAVSQAKMMTGTVCRMVLVVNFSIFVLNYFSMLCCCYF